MAKTGLRQFPLRLALLYGLRRPNHRATRSPGNLCSNPDKIGGEAVAAHWHFNLPDESKKKVKYFQKLIVFATLIITVLSISSKSGRKNGKHGWVPSVPPVTSIASNLPQSEMLVCSCGVDITAKKLIDAQQ